MNYGSVQLEGSFGPPPLSQPGRATPKPARRQTSFLTLKAPGRITFTTSPACARGSEPQNFESQLCRLCRGPSSHVGSVCFPHLMKEGGVETKLSKVLPEGPRINRRGWEAGCSSYLHPKPALVASARGGGRTPGRELGGFSPEREDSPVLPTPLAPTTAILTRRRPAAPRQQSAAAALPGAGYSAMVHMF